MRYSYPYGVFCVEALPNQPQLAHCHSFFVFEEHRGKGLGHVLKGHQNEVLAAMGYDCATCTVSEDNLAQRRILSVAGWHRLGHFHNRNTGKRTELWGYKVPHASGE